MVRFFGVIEYAGVREVIGTPTTDFSFDLSVPVAVTSRSVSVGWRESSRWRMEGMLSRRRGDVGICREGVMVMGRGDSEERSEPFLRKEAEEYGTHGVMGFDEDSEFDGITRGICFERDAFFGVV